MTLITYLKSQVSPGTIIIFREKGWQIGMTRVDNEDLYLYSLSDYLLHNSKVVGSGYEQRGWATEDILVLDVKLVCE